MVVNTRSGAVRILFESFTEQFKEGKRDPLEKRFIIEIIDFTPFEPSNPSEKGDLKFVSTFLHQTKPFIGPVYSSSEVGCGLMWALGWWNVQQIFMYFLKSLKINFMWKELMI
ncbi:hypothetical protein VP01_1899g2 [Puccinia sorghi]|uniref:Uncharacterized protein n=1 Tax=Puccinia sorghi TaxID=27349 RepID=A0A0L6VES2_9BASI|nr:hypothetical protein VP01_1899g2 [Puccinia sorghi]